MRTDHDSWDLATSVGATATMVAAQRALASCAPHQLIHDPYAAPLVRAVGIKFFTQLVDGDIELPKGTEFDPDLIARGIAVRTRFFDHHFCHATENGIRQAVILASGLDSRAYRLSWPEDVVLYEIDQPGVIKFKEKVLEELGVRPHIHHRAVGVDLRDDWVQALCDAGFDPTQPTVWSAEGLVMYLPSQAQDDLFDAVTHLSSPGSRLACDFVPDTSVFNTPERQERLEKGRQFGFDLDIGSLIYHGPRNNLLDYLADRKWDITEYPVSELYEKNGFEYPHDKLHQVWSSLIYFNAILEAN